MGGCELKVLELFSGIGGMHFALKDAQLHYPGIKFEVKLAVDINDLANKVYRHNFPDHRVENKNIKGLTEKFIHKLDINTILMSPPCQPFTRTGKFLDLEDTRTDPFALICDLIPQLPELEYILMENVMGFDKAKAREKYLEVLTQSGFNHQEYLVSPKSIGIPNSRLRYYCIARRRPFSEACKEIITKFSDETIVPDTLDEFLDTDVDHEKFVLSTKLLTTRFRVLDVVVPQSRNSMCFTKAYTHYLEGTGSVFSPTDDDTVKRCFEKVLNETVDSETGLAELRLRFFTPTEVAALMKFPEEFEFPQEITNKQRYRLLGNSINVAVVGKLVTLLIT